MADYQPLLTRALANLAGAGTLAARQAIYERARKAQLAQLQGQRPPLLESDIAREKEALDQAIAFVEAKFGGADSTLAKPSFAARTPTAATQQAGQRSAGAARTQTLIPPLDKLANVVPPTARAQASGSWPRGALAALLAAVLGAVLGLAGAAIVMHQNSQDLAGAPPEAPQEPAPQQPAKISQRAQLSPREGNSTAPAASVPPGSQLTGQSGAEAANPAADADSRALPGTARAVMLIASDNPQRPVVGLGSTVWSTIPPAPGHPATLAVRADADIPGLKMHATMTLRKNTDPVLRATYTMDLKFSFADGALIRGVEDVEPKMRNLGPTASEALTSVKVKLSDAYFLIALVKDDQDTARNLHLMQTRAWFDFSLLLNDNRIAKLLFQKSLEGEAMLTAAFQAWK